jgi:gluconokinase
MAGRLWRARTLNPVLLQSQFDTLEEPRDAIIVDISMAPEAIVNAIKSKRRS